MSPNQTICKSTISDPKLKNTPSKTDADKISPDDNTNLADNNEIGSSPDGINNKGKTPNNDKTIIGTDARRNNQQNDGKIDSFADGLNSLADTDGNSPVKPENNISDKSGISQRTKDLVSLQSGLAKKVTGSEVNDKKDESLLSPDGSKPMPVKPNTATPKDDNQGFYKQTESGEIKRLYPDTATPKNGSKMFSHENEGSGVIQSESGKVERKYSDTATVKSGNQVISQKSEDFEPVQPEAGKIEQNTDITIAKNSNNAGANISQIKSMGNGKIKGNQPSTDDSIKVPYDDKLKQQLGLGDRDELIKKQVQTYYKNIKELLKSNSKFNPNSNPGSTKLIEDALQEALCKKNNNTYVPASKIIIREFEQVTIEKGNTNNSPDRKLIVENHPEKIINGGKGVVSEYNLSDGKYTLASYHVNKSDGEGEDAERKLLYNFTAKEPVTITLDNMSFSTDKDEATSGALKKHDITLKDLHGKIYLNGEKLQDNKLKEIIKNGMKLKDKDTLSIETPSIKKDNNFTSDIGFNIKSENPSQDNNNPVALEIKSFYDREKDGNIKDKLGTESKEVYKITESVVDRLEKKKIKTDNLEEIVNPGYTTKELSKLLKKYDFNDTDINDISAFFYDKSKGCCIITEEKLKDLDKLKELKDKSSRVQITNETIENLDGNIDKNKLTSFINKKFSKYELRKKLEGAGFKNKETIERILSEADKLTELKDILTPSISKDQLTEKLKAKGYTGEDELKEILLCSYDRNKSYTNAYTEMEINAKKAYYEDEIKKYEEIIQTSDNKAVVAEAGIKIDELKYKQEEIIGKQVDKNNPYGTPPKGPNENKQVGGIFDNPDVTLTGNIDLTKNSYIRIDNSLAEVEGINGNKEPITNKGAFFENLHYDLTIEPTPEDLKTKKTEEIKNYYEVVLIPGGGNIALYDENGKLNIAKACNMKSGAIIIPATTSGKDGNYHLTFDYNVSGGSSLPVYAVIVKN
jgi:hypothetical protein